MRNITGDPSQFLRRIPSVAPAHLALLSAKTFIFKLKNKILIPIFENSGLK